MRIGIDARTILNPKEGEAIGSGHYTYQLLKNILELDKENEYVIFFDFRAREKDIQKFTKLNVRIVFYPFSDYRKYLPGAYNEILTASTLAKENLDVLHSTSPSSRIPSTYRGKIVVTFHDMAIYKIPECFPKTMVIRNKFSYRLMAKKADKIIAVSESIKKELDDEFKIGDKVEVIHGGLDERFFKEQEDGAGRILGKMGLDKKYILFLGTIEASKNITRVLQAFAQFKKKIIFQNKKNKDAKKFNYQLLLVGKRGWLVDDCIQLAKDLDIAKDIVFAGYVIGDELVPILKNAQFLVLPSLYEGFGMTVLESFATGLPVIASKLPSLEEIGRDAIYFVNPTDVNGIAEAMFEFSQSPELREEFRRKGLEISKEFNWRDVALKTIDVYNKIVS